MMKKRNLKDLTKTVNSDVISSLLNKASEDNLIRLVAYIPGALADNFFVWKLRLFKQARNNYY